MKQLCATLIVCSSAVLSGQQQTGPSIEWPYVGGDQAHTKYSPLDDINLSNVGELEIVWKWDAGETPLPDARPGSFQATPLMIDDTLYFSTMFSRVVAIDAETGTQKWIYDPRVYEDAPRGASPAGFHHRGVAFRRDGDELHLFLNSRTRLYAIDAATGQLIPSFGDDGSVLLTEGHGRDVPSETFDQTSPAVVYDDLVIVGSRVPDRVQRRFDTPGSVQAFDARTGERRWIFFTIPQSNDAFGADTWENQSCGSRVMRTCGD